MRAQDNPIYAQRGLRDLDVLINTHKYNCSELMGAEKRYIDYAVSCNIVMF